MRFELHNNDTLHTIRTTGDVYSKAEPYIDFIFANGIPQDTVSSFMTTHLPDCSGEARICGYGPSPVPDGYMVRVNGKSFRYIVEQLFSNLIMENYERVDIEDTVREIETIFVRRNTITPSISTAQRDILEVVVSPYVDSLFVEKDPVTSLKLMSHALKYDYLDVAGRRAVLAHHKIWNSVQDTVTEPSAQEDLLGSVNSISKFVAGHGALESAYEQMGVGIPKLDVQKRVVIDLMYKKFKGYFNVDDPKIDFIIYVALSENLTEHLSGIDFTNPDTAIAQFFASVALNVGRSPIDAHTNKSLIDNLDRYLLATNHNFEELMLKDALSPEQMEIYYSNAEKKSANLRYLDFVTSHREDKAANLENGSSWVSKVDKDIYLRGGLFIMREKETEKTYYEMLEVSVNASSKEIQNNYDRIMGMYAEAFYNGRNIDYYNKLTEAYKKLIDLKSRKKYDEEIKKIHPHLFNNEVKSEKQINITSKMIELGSKDTIAKLIAAGSDVDYQNHHTTQKEKHFTPLMIAINYEKYDIANMLLNAGANPNIFVESNSQYITALHLAFKKLKKLDIMLDHTKQLISLIYIVF